MVGRNLREEFRRKRLRWTAIDYHAKNYDSADDLTSRHSAGGIDRLSQSLANIHLDLAPNKIEAGLFTLCNRLPQGASWPMKSASARPSKRRWRSANIGPCGPGGAHPSTAWSGWLMFATNYDLTIARRIFGND